ncbi:MAG: carbohydrate-binding domain-containing protein [Rhodocyclaceae bacterium]
MALLIWLALSACGGGGGSVTWSSGETTSSSSSAASSSGTQSSASSSTQSSAATGAAGAWDLATGAHDADTTTANFVSVAIALDSLTVTSGSNAWAVASTSTGTVVTQDGSTVLTVAQDNHGLTITATTPAATPVALSLSGTYGKTITVYSDRDFKLDLAGVTLASTDGPALNIQSKQRAFVTLSGTNTLSDTTTWTARTLADGSSMDLKATFFSEGPLIFSGSGTLGIAAASKHALCSDAHVRLRSGTLSLNAAKKDGLRANDAFIMDGGALTITTAAGKGIKVEGKEDDSTPLGFIAINAGSLNITSYDKAITASWEAEDGDTTTVADDPDPRVTINGGTITVTTTGTPFETSTDSLSPEGIEAKSVLTINGGTLTLNTTDDGLNAGTHIAINGGRLYVKSSLNDAVDSNGTLTITGGLLVAQGAGAPEGALDADNNTFTVTGGTFVGIGGRNSSVTRAASTQNTVSLSNQAAGLLVIRDASSNVAFAYTLPNSAAAVLLSSPALLTGSRYTVYRGGTLASYSELFNGLYVDGANYTPGTAGSSFTLSSTVTSL